MVSVKTVKIIKRISKVGDGMYCSNCGSKLNKDSNFCHVCGHRVKDVEVLIREVDEERPEDLKTDKNISTSEKSVDKTEKVEDNKENKFLSKIKSLTYQKEEKPRSGDHEVASKLSDNIKKTKDIEKFEKAEDEKELLSDNIETSKEETEIKKKEPSKFKRFFDYMKEEEYVDDSLFKGNTSDKDSTESFEEEIDDIDKITLSKEDKSLEEEFVESERIAPTLEEDDKEETISEEKEIKEKKPSFIDKIKAFVAEEDEDNLLEMSPEEYKETFYGQGTKEDLEDDNKTEDATIENEIVEADNKKSIFDNFKNIFSNKDNENIDTEDYSEDEAIEEDDDEEYIPSYSYVDKEKTIRYSKRVIDSYLKKHEDGELDIEDFDHLEDFPIDENEDLEDEKSETVEFPIPEFEKREDIKKVKDVEIPDSEIETIEKDIDETENQEDSVDYYELVIDKPIDDTEEKIEKEDSKEEKVLVEKESIFKPVKEFFISIGKFFYTDKSKKDTKDEKDNIDIIINSPADRDDTMPLVLSAEEKEALNKELDKHNKDKKQSEVLRKSNAKVAPVIRDMINLGGKLTIPLVILIFAGMCFTISWVVNNPVFIIILSILKFIILYATISAATNSAFNSVGLRLKRNVVSLFIFLQMAIYIIIDAIYIRIMFIPGESVEALLNVMSPKILTILVFVLLAIFLLMLNYRKIKEKNGTIIFVGWYVVISSAITLVVILLELLLATILMTLFKEMMF